MPYSYRMTPMVLYSTWYYSQPCTLHCLEQVGALYVCTTSMTNIRPVRDSSPEAWDYKGSNFESCVWRAVSCHSSHHPQELPLVQFSLHMHKGSSKPHSFIHSFIRAQYLWLSSHNRTECTIEPCCLLGRSLECVEAETRRPNGGLMLAHRIWRWPEIRPPSCVCWGPCKVRG